MGTVDFIHGGIIVGSMEVNSGVYKVSTKGFLILNLPSLVTIKLTDDRGNPIDNQTVTLDETELGANFQKFTTLNDGTFSFDYTPTQLGIINIDYAGEVVGSLTVQPTYTNLPRLGGKTGSNTSLSVAVAQAGWTDAQNVILTRDDILVDAVTFVSLSKKLDAPILMTPSNSLDGSVWQEIKDLGAANVYIMGGTEAVSAAVGLEFDTALMNSGFPAANITRLSGLDRTSTALKIDENLAAPSSHPND
jgi:hypothetical protein